MLRTIFVFTFLGLALVLVLPWFVLWTLLSGNPDPMYHLAMRASAFALRVINVHVRVEGVENIPAGVCVFASNHASNLDPLVNAFVVANGTWAGHVSIVSADGIQMLAVRRN